MTCHVDHSWSDDPEYNVPLGQGEREAQWCDQFSDEPDNMPRTKNVDRVVGAVEHPPPLLQTRMQLLPCIIACIPRLGARAIPREIGSLTELSQCAAPQCPPPWTRLPGVTRVYDSYRPEPYPVYLGPG